MEKTKEKPTIRDNGENKKLTKDQAIEILEREIQDDNIKLIKNNIMILGMSLNNYKIYIPYDMILHIIHFTRNHIIEIPSIFKLIPKDIYSYNKKKRVYSLVHNKRWCPFMNLIS